MFLQAHVAKSDKHKGKLDEGASCFNDGLPSVKAVKVMDSKGWISKSLDAAKMVVKDGVLVQHSMDIPVNDLYSIGKGIEDGSSGAIH